MHQIVYTSTATEDFSTPDLRKLLLDARVRNRALGVSGMLVFHDRTFLQALEGEQRAVNEIFASIVTDRRHRDIDVLHRGPGFDRRVFGDWSMGFADFSGAADILRFCAPQRTIAHQGTRRLPGDGVACHLRGRGRNQDRGRLIETRRPPKGVLRGGASPAGSTSTIVI